MNSVHRAILAHIRETTTEPILTSLTDQQLIHRLFSNYRHARGLRLTQFGLHVMGWFFTAYDIEMPVGEVLSPKHLVCLDRVAKMPYYFDKAHIVVFDAEFGVKLRLVNGRLSMLMEMEAS